jgi:hypothetical protein
MEMNKDIQNEYNYFKLLEDIKSCYDQKLDRLEIPFSCAKDYPKDLCYRLQKLHLTIDMTNESILIKLPLKNNLTID